jgi:hypothetical protein
MKKPKQKEILILFFCLFIGFALRFYTFDKKSLWMDEVYTFNDSRDDLRAQLKFYKENPTFLHPPLFFIFTHLFYPFTKPERDLRIIPLIFGTLSIPMIYFLARLFSPNIALPCTLSLTFMVYHISVSQDGRSYSLLMFIGMAGLYFFMKHLKTLKKIYLILVALFYAILFHTSYSSIPYIALTQILWFYRANEEGKKPVISSFLILNGLILIICLPWTLLIGLNFKGQHLMSPFHTEVPGSLWNILYGVVHDWVLHAPLLILSVILLILFPSVSNNKKNAFLLLAVLVLPVVGLYLFSKLLNLTHFFSSRYVINFLPLFFISIYLSLNTIEVKFEKLKRFMRLRFLFVIPFIASNLLILPLYYRSEKQDLRGLVTYLKEQIRDGDKIFDLETMATLGILHYFGASPEGRHFILDYLKVTEKEFEYRKSFIYQNRKFTIYYSKSSFAQYVADGSRLWIVASKWGAKEIKGDSACVLKGFFDGSFYNLSRFPTDASMYLFLWDPKSPNEKGIDMPIE